MQKIKVKLNHSINHIILIVFSIVSIYPIFWIITTSLKTREQYLQNKIGVSWPFTFKSILAALESANFFRWILNSVVITGCSVILVTVISIAAAYALTKLKIAGKKVELALED